MHHVNIAHTAISIIFRTHADIVKRKLMFYRTNDNNYKENVDYPQSLKNKHHFCSWFIEISWSKLLKTGRGGATKKGLKPPLGKSLNVQYSKFTINISILRLFHIPL